MCVYVIISITYCDFHLFGTSAAFCYRAGMHSWQLPLLGLHDRPADLSDFEIAYFFSFSVAEQNAIASRRSAAHRVAAALHLGFMKMTGRTLAPFDPVPPKLFAHLGQELELPTPELTSLRVLFRLRTRSLTSSCGPPVCWGFGRWESASSACC